MGAMVMADKKRSRIEGREQLVDAASTIDLLYDSHPDWNVTKLHAEVSKQYEVTYDQVYKYVTGRSSIKSQGNPFKYKTVEELLAEKKRHEENLEKINQQLDRIRKLLASV